MKASPAWTLSPKLSPKASFAPPGPGAYEFRSDKTVGFTLGTAQRLQTQRSIAAPGPGAYSPNVKEEKPGFRCFLCRFGGGHRTPIAVLNQIPGPGAYGQEAKPTGPKFPFTSRKSGEMGKEGPGPGHYQPKINSQTADLSPNWSFGKGGRVFYRTDTDIPGPGIYEVRSTITGKGPIFGSENRSKSKRSESPGPGAYDVKERELIEGKKGFSMSFRHPLISSMSEIPGPGAYDLVRPMAGEKGFHLSQAARAHFFASKTPGPGTYNPTLLTSASVPGLRSGHRVPLVQNNGVPGPGTYDLEVRQSAPEVHMKWRHSESSKAGLIPGPGQYNPSATARGKESVPNWSFGKGNKQGDSLRKEGPGPGNYSPKSVNSFPLWTFGSAQRGRAVKNESPGPGTYDVKASLPAVPSYLLPS